MQLSISSFWESYYFERLNFTESGSISIITSGLF